mmetsp:Transcript_20356/g.35118  ORF Transcript_20356/g.35118 Transcript_20356/m.35118 type:complete len:233 (-) Transcript_20356:197-895(-)
MLLTMTTWDTPAALAASIWFFWPIQSTSSGVPPGAKLKVGRPGFWQNSLANRILIIEKNWILGTADVQITTASAPANASARSSTGPVTLALRTAESPRPRLAKVFKLLALFTRPMGLNSGALINFCVTSLPVRPPAPVTTTLRPLVPPVVARATRRGLENHVYTVWNTAPRQRMAPAVIRGAESRANAPKRGCWWSAKGCWASLVLGSCSTERGVFCSEAKEVMIRDLPTFN